MSACAKCGGTDIHTRYHAKGCERAGCSCSRCPYDSNAKTHAEHLHFTCRTCGWDWLTPPLTTASEMLSDSDASKPGGGSS